MGEQSAADEYEHVTSNHAKIHQVVNRWGGRAAVTDIEGEPDVPALRFGGASEDTRPVYWDEFFDRLDANNLALAYQSTETDGTPPEYEFVSRRDDEMQDPTEGVSPVPEEQVIDKPNEQISNRRSEIRERKAEKKENIDNHRDRRPFQS